MADFKKHVGKIKNTDKRCVVIIPQMPDDKEYALIVDTDALPDFMHDSLFRALESKGGQEPFVLGEYLVRVPSPDEGIDLLNSLHKRGFIQKQKISNIKMFPKPNDAIELSEIVKVHYDQEVPSPKESKSQEEIASDLLREATELEETARSLREKAYIAAPHFRPHHDVSDETISYAAETNSAPAVVDDASLDPEMRRIQQEEEAKLKRLLEEEEKAKKEKAKVEPKTIKATPKKRGRPKKTEKVEKA